MKTHEQLDTLYNMKLASPLGTLGLKLKNGKLTKIGFLLNEESVPIEDPFAKRVAEELEAYFKNPKHLFTIPIEYSGTAYQVKVWEALQTIPPGDVLAYSELAERLNTGARAIGNVCRLNQLPIIIPCHRVVAKNHLGGYTGNIKGPLLDIKRWLLQHEQKN